MSAAHTSHQHGPARPKGPPDDPERARQVRRVTWAALFSNLAISTLKMTAGLLGHSQAIVADAVHSLSDSVTDVAVLIGVRYWLAPADQGHPHGHRRIETLITVVIGVLLGGVGAGIVYHSIVTLPRAHGQPEWVAFWAALVSIAGKEGLYQWTAAVGRRIRSPAVVANAWHHRSDGLSSVPAALAVLAARLLGQEWAFIDHVGAVVVSFFIFRAAWKIARPALGELTDAGASEEVRENLARIARETEGVRGIHGLRTRYLGSALQVDLHVLVDPELPVRRGHDISESVKCRLISEGPDVVDVVTHLEPEGHAASEDSRE